MDKSRSGCLENPKETGQLGPDALGMVKGMMSAQSGLFPADLQLVIALTVKIDIWKGCGLRFIFFLFFKSRQAVPI